MPTRPASRCLTAFVVPRRLKLSWKVSFGRGSVRSRSSIALYFEVGCRGSRAEGKGDVVPNTISRRAFVAELAVLSAPLIVLAQEKDKTNKNKDKNKDEKKRKPRRRRTKRRTRRKTRPTTERRSSTRPEPTTLRTGGRIDARTQPRNHPGADRARSPPLGGSSSSTARPDRHLVGTVHARRAQEGAVRFGALGQGQTARKSARAATFPNIATRSMTDTMDES